MRKWLILVALVAVIAAAIVLYLRPRDPLRLGGIALPPGFEISLYAEHIRDAQSMALGGNGTLFVGTESLGLVYAISDLDGNDRAEVVDTVARGLRTPSGLALLDGALYVAEGSRVIRFDNIEAQLTNPPTPFIVNDRLPAAQTRTARYLRFGPDQMLYVSVPAPCDICETADERLATIMRMNADGSGLEVFARGVRQSRGFDWHPETGALWFTDNGPDEATIGEAVDELNRATEPGAHFGFPYCHGAAIIDPELGAGRSCEEFEAPVRSLDPGVSPFGMRFHTGTTFPPDYSGQIFVAEHGSETGASGYRITRVMLDGNQAVAYEPFGTGFADVTETSGRLTDLLVRPDGALLVSDAGMGAIYVIRYVGP